MYIRQHSLGVKKCRLDVSTKQCFEIHPAKPCFHLKKVVYCRAHSATRRSSMVGDNFPKEACCGRGQLWKILGKIFLIWRGPLIEELMQFSSANHFVVYNEMVDIRDIPILL